MNTTPISRRERGYVSLTPDLCAHTRMRPLDGFPLIVHADDFGETAEITDGICQSIEAGVVTSTSIVANMPATQYALRRVHSLAEQASFGVHLNLCEGRPLIPGLTLVGTDGEFHGKRALIERAVLGKLSMRELEAEIVAQIALVRDSGVAISHVDGHKHLHQLPLVSVVVAKVLPQFDIRRVRLMRTGSRTASRKFSTALREFAAWRAARVFGRAGLRSPVRAVDLTEVLPGGRPNHSPAALTDPHGPVELCCHPALAAETGGKPSSHRRPAELEYLLSDCFRQLLKESQSRLVSYWQV
jgi:chitin disaccharide deacetylase